MFIFWNFVFIWIYVIFCNLTNEFKLAKPNLIHFVNMIQNQDKLIDVKLNKQLQNFLNRTW